MSGTNEYLSEHGANPNAEAAAVAMHRLFAQRMTQGLARRLYPHSPLRRRMLADRLGMRAETLREQVRAGTFSMALLARIEAELALDGLPGLYDEVVGEAGQPQGPWRAERLNLDSLQDKLRGRMLAEVRLGHSPLEVAAGMGLLNEAVILQRAGGEFFSIRVGEALPVDRGLQGKPVSQRADAVYAGMIARHLDEAEAQGPTLYLLDGGSIRYERLALPGKDGLMVTLPFNRQVAPGLKVR